MQERTAIRNKNNVWMEMTLIIVDQIALATADSAALRQYEAFSSHETRVNQDSTPCSLNKSSGNAPLVYQSH